jgi:hypothetical protein
VPVASLPVPPLTVSVDSHCPLSAVPVPATFWHPPLIDAPKSFV